MSKYQLQHSIREELRRVNEIIDRKIVEGASYMRESKRHKKLLRELTQLRGGSFWGRSLGFLTFF